MQLTMVMAALFALSVAVFAVQNAAPVDVRFFFWQFRSVSLVLVILGSLLIGALIIFLVNLVKLISLKRKLSVTEKRNEFLEREIERLRAIKEQPPTVPVTGQEPDK